MESFTYECVTLVEVCDHNKLDYENIMNQVQNSDVSFGTNADTLITGQMLNDILETYLDFAQFDNNVLISLGS